MYEIRLSQSWFPTCMSKGMWTTQKQAKKLALGFLEISAGSKYELIDL